MNSPLVILKLGVRRLHWTMVTLWMDANSILAMLKLQMRQLRWTMIILWIFIAGFILFMGGLYPGDQGMVDLLKVFQSPEFQPFIKGLPPNSTFFYGYWYSIMITTFSPIILIGVGLFLGVDTITREEADKTFDIGFSVPESRLMIFCTRIFGGLLYIGITSIIGLLSSVLIDIIINKIIDIMILEQLWFSLTILAVFGYAVGILLGAVLFDRGIGFQIAFIYLALSYIYTLVIEDISNTQVTNFLNMFNIYNYLNAEDILFLNTFHVDTLYPIIGVSVVLVIIASIIFISRNLLETEFRPFYIYLSPLYWVKKRKTKEPATLASIHEPNVQVQPTSRFSFSKLLISWSYRFQDKAPVFVDELTAHGLFLLIYAILVFLGIFLQLITYPGDTQALEFLAGFQNTPIYLLLSDNYNISTKPYLGYAIAQYLALTWFYFLPFVVYRFYHMELRDNGKTDETFWTNPVSMRQIFIQRCLAIFVEYYIIIIVACLGFIIPEIILQKTADTPMEILTSFLTGPLYLSLGLFISVMICYVPKKGKYLAVGGILAAFVLYLVGSLNKNVTLLAQITPFYYYDPVSFLYGGIQLANSAAILLFGVIIGVLLILRIMKPQKYVTD